MRLGRHFVRVLVLPISSLALLAAWGHAQNTSIPFRNPLERPPVTGLPVQKFLPHPQNATEGPGPATALVSPGKLGSIHGDGGLRFNLRLPTYFQSRLPLPGGMLTYVSSITLHAKISNRPFWGYPPPVEDDVSHGHGFIWNEFGSARNTGLGSIVYGATGEHVLPKVGQEPPLPAQATALIYSPDCAGSLFYEFVNASGVPTGKAEMRHVDGTIEVFEMVPSSNPPEYRLDYVLDPFDNKIDYTYQGGTGVLHKIRYPTGLTEVWNYDVSWAAGSYYGIEVTYENIPAGETLTSNDLKWGMVFEPTPYGSSPFLGGRLFRVFYPKTPYLPTPASGSLFNTSSSSTAYTVYEFGYSTYGTGLDAHDLLTSIKQYRSTTLTAGTLSSPVTTLQVGYVPRGNDYRVSSQAQPEFNATTVFQYALYAGTDLIQSITETNPVGTTTVHTLDLQGRPIQRTITPTNNVAGRPRHYASDKAQLGVNAVSEPSSITWSYGYTGAAPCGMPNTITDPSNRLTEFHYNSDTLLLESVSVPNPANPTSTVQYSYGWIRQGSSYSGWYLGTFTGPDGIWTNSYGWVPRVAPANGISYGFKPANLTTTSPSVSLEDGSWAVVTQTTTYNAFTPPNPQSVMVGQVTSVIDGDGVRTDIQYDTTNGYPDLITVNSGGGNDQVVTDVAYNVAGHLKQRITNYGSTLANTFTYVSTVEGVQLEESTFVNGVNIKEEVYLDRWGQDAVVLKTNRKSNGTEPNAFNGTAEVARTKVRKEYQYRVDRLTDVYEDRRPIDRNESGTVSGSSDARMLRTQYAYRADGVLSSVTNPNGGITEYTHDGYGTLYRVVDKNSAGTKQVAQGRFYINSSLELITALEGDVTLPLWTVYVRNAAGAVQSITEPSIPSAPTGYSGSLGGAVHQLTYDSSGRVTIRQVMDGITTLARTDLVYDQLGRVRRRTEAILGGGASGQDVFELSTLYGSGKETQVAKVTRTGGRLVGYEYDTAGRLKKVKDSNGTTPNEVQYAYHSKTDFSSQITQELYDNSQTPAVPRSYVTTYTMDVLGRVTQIQEKGLNGTQTALNHGFSYYTLGMTETYTDPLGKVSRFLPDALGRLVESVEDGGSANILNSTVFVDWTGTDSRSRVERRDGRNRLTVTHYDFANRLFLVQNPGAKTPEPTLASPYKPFWILADFDAASRTTRQYTGLSGSSGVETRLHYDGPGRLILRESPNAHTQSTVSDWSTRDAYYRDRLGRITDMISFGGNIASPIQHAQIQFDQDSLGRIHKERYLYTYGGPNMVTVASGFSGGDLFRTSLTYSNGLAMTYTPDPVGRIAQVNWTGGSTSILAKYSHMGSNTSRRDVNYSTTKTGITTFTFDVYGRMASLTDKVGSTQISGFQYEYDAAGNLKKERYTKLGPGGVGDRFDYDVFQRLKDGWLGVNQATMDAATVNPSTAQFVQRLTYNLDAANNRSSVVTKNGPSGSQVSEFYVTQDSWHPQGESNRYYSVDSVPLTYDDRGNILYDGRHAYVYDYLNRLSEVYDIVYSSSSMTSVPELLSTAQKVDPMDLPDASAFFEARAEILRRTGGIGQILENHGRPDFQWRLTAPLRMDGGKEDEDSAEEAEVAGETLVLTAVYVHDGFNRRILRAIMGVNTFMSAYDGWREVEEHTLQGGLTSPIKQFVWGERLDEQVAYKEKNGAVWSTYFINNGGQDSVTRILNTSGTVVQAKEYDPYGKETVFNPGGTTSNPYSWKGHRLDPESGLIYMRNRYYSPFHGRFMTQDPLGVWGDSLNLGNEYAYAANAPQIHEDPFGLQVRVVPGSMPVLPDSVSTVACHDVGGVSDSDRDFRTTYGELGFGRNPSPYESELSLWDLVPIVGTVRAFASGDILGGILSLVGDATLIVGAGAGIKAFLTGVRGEIVEGVYEFVGHSGRTYVGQSGNIPERLRHWIAEGRLPKGAEVTRREILGGKTAREVWEQRRIDELGGVRHLENIRNAIGKRRAHILQAFPNAPTGRIRTGPFSSVRCY